MQESETAKFNLIVINNHFNTKISLLEYGGYSEDTEGLDTFYWQLRKLIQKSDEGLDDLLDQLDRID